MNRESYLLMKIFCPHDDVMYVFWFFDRRIEGLFSLLSWRIQFQVSLPGFNESHASEIEHQWFFM